MKPSKWIKDNTDIFSISSGPDVNNKYLEELDKRFIDIKKVSGVINTRIIKLRKLKKTYSKGYARAKCNFMINEFKELKKVLIN